VNTRESFGAKLQQLRKQKRLTQEELAAKAGLSRKKINMIENGRSNPGLDILNRIADALESTVEIAPTT